MISRALGRALVLTCLLSFALGAAAPRPARALDRDVRALLVAGGYGMLGGTVLGLASFPVSQDVRTIFIGTSVGLYLGLAVGIYYVLHREDPQNPFRSEAALAAPPSLHADAPRAFTPPDARGPELRLAVFSF